MEKTKVISVRLPESLIQKLDDMAIDRVYWKRNSIIEKALSVLVECTDAKTQYDIMRYWGLRNETWKLSFEKVTEKASEPCNT